MPVYSWNAIFLGSAPDMDTDETDITAEGAASLLGTYGNAASPLFDQVVGVTVDDVDGDTSINSNNDAFASPDPMTIDGVAHTMDSGAVYNATITYTDGTTATITAVVMQTTDGDLYLLPEMAQNADFFAMQAKPIESLTLNSVNTDTTNIAANRQQTSFVCFASGTLIATPEGARRVETLRVGDRVLTLDHGAQEICWTGQRRVGVVDQFLRSGTPPVRVPAFALGPAGPQTDLYLSQQHRVLLSSPVADRMYGSPQILMAVKKLAGLQGIALRPLATPLVYHHFACARHEVVFANGLAVETLHRGHEARRLLGPEAATALAGAAGDEDSLPARPFAEGRRGRTFLERITRRMLRMGYCDLGVGLDMTEDQTTPERDQSNRAILDRRYGHISPHRLSA